MERTHLMRVGTSILLYTGLLISGCASNKTIAEIDYNAEFENGKAALNNKKYIRAQEKFNTVVVGASHTELGDDALFYLGESYYYAKDYLLAVAEYDRLTRRMPFSPYVESARYRICQSYVTISPKYL